MEETYINIINTIANLYSEEYLSKMHQYFKENEINSNDISSFVMNPKELIIYLGRNFIAIENCSNPYINEDKEQFDCNIKLRDYSKEDIDTCQFIQKIIGFNFDSTSGVKIPLSGIKEGLIIPTNAGMDKLIDLKWNFAAYSDPMIGFNTSIDIEKDAFLRLVNCRFYDEQNGNLKTRLIKWIDFIPCEYNKADHDKGYDVFKIDYSIYKYLWKIDMFYKYPIPNNRNIEKLQRVNEFIEYFANSQNSETDITNILAKKEYKFILCMGFMGKDIFDQVECRWQSERKANIIPDFFVVKSNGFADIVEFKLPKIKGKTIVGSENRERFNAQIQSYIAQTRSYANYFDDPNNRKWFEENYGFKVYRPKRYLVIGRRSEFDIDIWYDIKSEYSNLEIVNYDDLVDTVISQLYI